MANNDMVKKSADITQADEKYLENNPINFSKFVRTKIAEERFKELDLQKKKVLWNQLNTILDKAKKLREEWKHEREELKQGFDAEVTEKQRLYWVFKMNGVEWSTDWMAEEIYDTDGNKATEDVKEFARQFTNLWQTKVEEFESFVEENTYFRHEWQDEHNQTYKGTNVLDQFTVKMGYIPTGIESFKIKFEDSVRVDIQDIERVVN